MRIVGCNYGLFSCVMMERLAMNAAITSAI